MKILSLLSLAAASFVLVACNTVDGMGRDIERGGEKMQDASGH
jgi:entericidin B